jgi:hypothetical protein
MTESAELKAAFDSLVVYKQNLVKSLNKIKDQKSQNRKKA